MGRPPADSPLGALEICSRSSPYDRHDADGSWYRAMVWDRNHQVADTVPVDRTEVIDTLTRAKCGTTSASVTSAGYPGSTATSDRSHDTGTAECSWPVTPRTFTPQWAGRA